MEALRRTFVLPPSQPSSAAAVLELRRRGLRLGNFGLLIEHDFPGEILEHADPQPLPRVAAWCCGLIGLRGRLLPALDLHRYLGMSRPPNRRQWWLALGADSHSVAFLVDELPQLVRLSPAAALIGANALPASLQRHVGAAYSLPAHGATQQIWFDFRHREFFAQLADELAR
jgi:chemotaxis signal transduction protein